MGYLSSLFFLLIFITDVRARGYVFDVRRFGAVADGKTDNSKALSDAWTKACESAEDSVVSVPDGTFMVGPVVFEGPCKASNIDFGVTGTLKAPDGRYTVDQDSWITFQYVNGLTLRGGGTFDGQGATAWRYNDCTTNPNCKRLPVSLRFNFVNDSNVKDITSLNSKNFHMQIFECHNMGLDALTITAPWDSPNTDGMHIAVSSDIRVTRSRIGTGDDCISVGPGIKSLVVSGVFCGPGHGISIGSLGKTPEEEPVTGLVVRNCTFSGTDNGLRIKTWAPSSPGLVNNITFADIFFEGSSNPIIIDQQYCPSGDCDIKASSGVLIKGVRFSNIWGYSRTKVAVALLCSRSKPCRGIKLKDINIRYRGEGGGPATSFCANVYGAHFGVQNPAPCI